jgi:hypothetical protein
LSLSGFLFLNIFFQTKSDPGFISTGMEGTVKNVLLFHMNHPQEIITYLILFVFPAIFYGLFRANRFYEKGFLVNKGLPFYNKFTLYTDLDHYQIVHTKFLISLFKKDTKEEVLIPVKDMERVLAILDQNAIPGKLKQELKIGHFTSQSRYLYFVFMAALVTFLVQYFNVAYYFWRTKWW